MNVDADLLEHYLYDTEAVDRMRQIVQPAGGQDRLLQAHNRLSLLDPTDTSVAKVQSRLETLDGLIGEEYPPEMYQMVAAYSKVRAERPHTKAGMQRALAEIHRLAATYGAPFMDTVVNVLNSDGVGPFPLPSKVGLQEALRLFNKIDNRSLIDYLTSSADVDKYREANELVDEDSKTRLDLLTHPSPLARKTVHELEEADRKIGQIHTSDFYEAILTLNVAWRHSQNSVENFKKELQDELRAAPPTTKEWERRINEAAALFGAQPARPRRPRRQQPQQPQQQPSIADLDSAFRQMLLEDVKEEEPQEKYTRCPAGWQTVASGKGAPERWISLARENPHVNSLCFRDCGGEGDCMFSAIATGWNEVVGGRAVTFQTVRNWAADGITPATYGPIVDELVHDDETPPQWVSILSDPAVGERWRQATAQRENTPRLTLEESNMNLLKHMLKKPGDIWGDLSILNALTGDGTGHLNPIQDKNLAFIILLENGTLYCDFYNPTPSYFMLLYLEEQHFSLAGISIDNRVQSVFHATDMPTLMRYLFDKSCGDRNPLQILV